MAGGPLCGRIQENPMRVDAQAPVLAYSRAAASPMEVRGAQRYLNELGQQPALEEDGVLGPETRAALQEFQRDVGLEATGQLDILTLENLTARVMEQAAESIVDEAIAAVDQQRNTSRGHRASRDSTVSASSDAPTELEQTSPKAQGNAQGAPRHGFGGLGGVARAGLREHWRSQVPRAAGTPSSHGEALRRAREAAPELTELVDPGGRIEAQVTAAEERSSISSAGAVRTVDGAAPEANVEVADQAEAEVGPGRSRLWLLQREDVSAQTEQLIHRLLAGSRHRDSVQLDWLRGREASAQGLEAAAPGLRDGRLVQGALRRLAGRPEVFRRTADQLDGLRERFGRGDDALVLAVAARQSRNLVFSAREGKVSLEQLGLPQGHRTLEEPAFFDGGVDEAGRIDQSDALEAYGGIVEARWRHFEEAIEERFGDEGHAMLDNLSDDARRAWIQLAIGAPNGAEYEGPRKTYGRSFGLNTALGRLQARDGQNVDLNSILESDDFLDPFVRIRRARATAAEAAMFEANLR